jgi:hypothetical protein
MGYGDREGMSVIGVLYWEERVLRADVIYGPEKQPLFVTDYWSSVVTRLAAAR